MNPGKFAKFIAMAFVLFFAFALSGCNKYENANTEVSVDEISLRIQLDVQEDVGLVLIDYSSDAGSGNVGLGNADKSMLKHNELLIENFTRENFDSPSDAVKLTLQFKIITDCTEPHMDFDYPEELTKILDAVYLEAQFGKSYDITIRGDKTNGYKAVLES